MKTEIKNVDNNEMIEDKDEIFYLNECFDADLLNHILTNKESFKKQLYTSRKKRDDPDLDEEDPFKMAEKYFKKSSGGSNTTKYKQNRTEGRFYAVGSLSLQNLHREIRHTIARDFYVDIDISNCHPVILSHLCDVHGVKCKNLKDYIDHRKVWFEELSTYYDVNTGYVKTSILSLMNGGASHFDKALGRNEDIDEHCEKMKQLNDEFMDIHEFFTTGEFKVKFELWKKKTKKTYNLSASFLNTLLLDKENDILFTMYEFFGSPKTCVLCFDGIMMLNNGIYDLEKCEAHIEKEWGIKVKLAKKPMNYAFKIDKRKVKPYWETYDTEINTIYDLANIDYNKIYTVKYIESVISSCIFPIMNGGNSIFLTNNREHDNKTNKDIATIGKTTLKNLEICLNRSVKIRNPKYKDQLRLWDNMTEKEVKKRKQKDAPVLVRDDNVMNILNGMLSINTLKRFSRVGFEPYLWDKDNVMEKKEDAFNLFRGFPFQQDFLDAEPEEIERRCKIFEKSKVFRHINKIMCDDNTDAQAYLNDYIAHMFQKPKERTDTFIIFIGEKGAGKDMFGLFLSNMLGSNHCWNYEQLDELFTPFNSEQEGKILITINEITDKGSHFHKHDRLKHIITQEKLNVKIKYVSPYSIDCFAHFFGNTNNKRPMHITGDSRRFVELKLADLNNGKPYINYPSYFKPIWVEEVENADFIKSAFYYYCSRDISGFNPRVHPTLKYQETQKEQSVNKSIEFVLELFREIIGGEYGDSYDRFKLDGEYIIPYKELFMFYCSWCEECKIKPHPRLTFKNQIETIFKKKDYYKKRRNCYVLNEAIIETEIRLYFRNDKWTLLVPNDSSI